MKAETWIPGTNRRLDTEFELLRTLHYNLKSHDLWQNYSAEHFQSCAALSIGYDANGYPQYCSSILTRDCWPRGVFRVLNRFWKVNPDSSAIPFIHPIAAELLRSQINWVHNNEHRLIFISRETAHWQKFAVRNLSEKHQIDFMFKSQDKYLTCDDLECDSCWQTIVYQGDSTVLNEWTHKCYQTGKTIFGN